jgi:hypothetical protein
MRFKLLLRAAGLLAMLVTVATRSTQADSSSPAAAADAPIVDQDIRYVSIRRPPPLATCAALEARGPSIDAIEVRRRGVVIGTGVAPFISSARCSTGMLTDRVSPNLGGAPDGVGVALGGNEYGWSLGEHVALRAGDEIVVTVLDGANEPFQVFAGAEPVARQIELGTLTSSGTVTVPAR